MANSIFAIDQLTFGGTDVQESAYGIQLQLVRGYNELPEVRGDDLVIPTRVGLWPGTRIRTSRAVILEGIVTGSGATAALELSGFRAKWATFIALFDPTLFRVLSGRIEDGTTKTISCRTKNILVVQEVPMMAEVSVELESLTPDWA